MLKLKENIIEAKKLGMRELIIRKSGVKSELVKFELSKLLYDNPTIRAEVLYKNGELFKLTLKGF